MRTSPDPSNPAKGDAVDAARRAGQGKTFGVAAAAYERGRPPYPQAAIDWLVPATAVDVVDLGAGTGKFTRQLLAPNRNVVAIDPDAEMLAELRRVVPGVRTEVGSAEALPLADSSVDVITVAQAWHWVDLDRAVPEVARVLRPGGQLGLVWNVRDESAEWVAELSMVIHQGGSQELTERDPIVGTPFAPLERQTFSWTHTVSTDAFRDMVASRSYVIVLPPDEREQVINDTMRVALHAQPDSNVIKIPYVTYAYRTQVAGVE